jgi:hypothetical protein
MMDIDFDAAAKRVPVASVAASTTVTWTPTAGFP